MTILPHVRRASSVVTAVAAAFAFCALAPLQAQRIPLQTRTIAASETSSDAGQLPLSQPLQLTLHLAPTPDRAAALDTFLAAQTNTASPSFHKWLTPQQFAANFGATDDQISVAKDWLQAQGLTLSFINTARTRLTVTGSTAQVQSALAVSLHRYQVNGKSFYANATQPSLPHEIAASIAAITGLSDLPATADTDTLVTTIDANTTPILTLPAATCVFTTDLTLYRNLFRQANAQGMTIVADTACANLSEVTAIAAATSSEPRPTWQVVPGLPADAFRHAPDLTVPSAAEFAQALATIELQTGSRQGNINGVLYSLATTPGVYSQDDITSATPNTWKPTTGLGVVDLATLIKVYPRVGGILATTSSLTSSNYAPAYGQQFTLTSKVLAPVYGNAQPSGTVTFSAAAQGTLGTASIDTSGLATLNLTTPLNVGVYNVTATYSGDANYSASTSAPAVILTVTIANGALTASISPTSNVPYGNTATVTATVTLPGSTNAAPAGTVSAAIQGITGAVFTNTLTPNPGGNSATTNIVVAAPAPGTYTVQVTCAGNTNYQCQTPVNLPFSTVKGNTVTTITVTPAAPQAGQPVSLTAVIGNAGNGTDTYNFTGNVTFYDNGKLLATGAVGTNQATTTATLSGNITHNIVAVYTGDSFWNASTSAAKAVSPTLLPATLTLSSNYSTALAGVNIVFTATVFTTVANTVGPTGTITLWDTFNGSIVSLGTATLAPNGPNQSIAVFSTTGMIAGNHSVYAVYNGDSNFITANSSTLPITISDYSLIMNPASLTISVGKSGQAVLLLGLVGGFNGTVSFGCTPPAGTETTCSFNPVTLTGGGTTTMTIATTAPHVKPTQQASGRGLWLTGGGTALAMLFCFMLPRRRTIPALLAILLSVGLTATIGCDLNATAVAPITDTGTPLGTQNFTITTAGTDGVSTVRHTYTYQVTFQ